MEPTIENSQPVEIPRKSIFDRLIGIFTEPVKTYRYLNQHPAIGFAVCIPIMAIFLYSLASSIQTVRNPDTFKNVPATFGKAMQYATPVIICIFAILFGMAAIAIKTTIIHVTAPFMDGKSDFKRLFMVLCYASAPGLIGGLAYLIFVLLNPGVFTPLLASPAFYFTQKKVGYLMFSFWSNFELFGLWGTLLGILGIMEIYRFKWVKATSISLILFMLYLGLSMGLAKVMEPIVKAKQEQQEPSSQSTESTSD